ncbi:MAG: tetratricopeptide repeat protein [Anaerolineae bacterium]
MTISEPRLRSLLRQAKKVADSGKRAAAVKLYRQIIEEAPDSDEAWLGLAELLTDPQEKKQAYERVVALSPDGRAAQAAQARLRGEPVPETAAPPDEAHANNGRESALATASAEPAAAQPPPEHPSEHDRADHHDHEHGVHEHGRHEHGDEIAADEQELVCYRHPGRETALRCYTCGRPICSQCAVKTPVGYRCPTCIREAEDVFFNAKPLDYVIAPLAALPLSLLAGFLALRLGGGLFMFLIIFFIGGAAGGLIGRIAKRAVGRRRGRYLPHLVSATVIIGVLVWAAPILLYVFLGNLGALAALLAPGIYLFVAASAAYYQMK